MGKIANLFYFILQIYFQYLDFRFWKIINQDVDYLYKVISMGHPLCHLIRETGESFQYNKFFFRENIG